MGWTTKEPKPGSCLSPLASGRQKYYILYTTYRRRRSGEPWRTREEEGDGKNTEDCWFGVFDSFLPELSHVRQSVLAFLVPLSRTRWNPEQVWLKVNVVCSPAREGGLDQAYEENELVNPGLLRT